METLSAARTRTASPGSQRLGELQVGIVWRDSDDGSVAIALLGRLEWNNADLLRLLIERLFRSGARSLAVSCTGLSYLSLEGILALRAVAKRARELDCGADFLHLEPAAQVLLELLGFGEEAGLGPGAENPSDFAMGEWASATAY